MPKIDDIKSIQIQVEDGSLWSAHWDEDCDELVFDSQIEPPKPSGSSPSPSPEPLPEGKAMKEMIDKMAGKGKSLGETPLEESKLPEDVKKQMDDKTFRAKLASVMLDNKYDRRIRGRSRGKLDMKALYKVPTQARSVFTQKQARKNKEYNVCLLVDESGSMADDNRCGVAAEVTTFLARNFEGININLAIIGFNRNISVLKDWDRKIDYDKVYNDIATMHHHMGHGDNNDYDAMYRGYKMFETAPKGQNILIMMSDGEPAQTRSYYFDIDGKEQPRDKMEKGMLPLSSYDKEEKHHLHALANSHKDVISIGVGIQQGGWQIPNHFKVDNLDRLKPEIIKALKGQIKRG